MVDNNSGKVIIEWVNHAGFIIRYGDFAVISDPWLFGSIFHNGWDLLSPSRFQLDDFGSISHIWFSHEHPDHFTPPVIKQIPEVHRNRLKVLFQYTKDKRLKDFCEGSGMEVRELELLKTEKITEDVEVICNKNGTEDSWIFLRVGDCRILNLNDCIFTSDKELEEVRDRVGEVDVLLSIFGYAEKIGEPGQNERRREESQKWVDMLIRETEVFKPSYVIPFASFKYFSHEENFYNNEGALSPREVYEEIQSRVSCQALMFYPGDKWEVGTEFDSEPSVSRYMADWESRKPLHFTADPVPMEKLIELSKDYTSRFRKTHSVPILRALHWAPASLGLRALKIYLMDQKKTVLFSVLNPCREINSPREEADAEMSSECLAFLYEFDYGGNTLLINARYTGNERSNRLLYNVAHLGLMQSADESLNLSYLLKNFARALRMLKTRSSGQGVSM